MHKLDKRMVGFALCLSALAGFVDAIGFLELGGTFVSFMSGNSTKLAVGLMKGNWSHVALLAGIIGDFVLGSMLGTMVALRSGRHRQAAVLMLVTALLTIASLCYTKGSVLPAMLLLALAMGAENAVFQRAGDIVIGLTYMTGTLAKIGQRLAYALLGGDKFSWVPYLVLWLGLISGGATGTMLFLAFGLKSLWLGVAWSALMTAIAAVRRERAGHP